MKEIVLKIHRIDHYESVLINDNGDRFHFDSHTSNGEELGDFLNGCKELQQRQEAEREANDLIWKIERYCDALNKSSNEPKILEMIQDYKSKKG